MASLPKVLQTILSAKADQNLRFADLDRVLTSLGFTKRVSGGHHIYSREDVVEIVNLQPLPGGKAKAYQVKQVRQLITRYGLSL